jgi:hypothetical protein
MQREQLSESDRFIVNLTESIEARHEHQRNSLNVEKVLNKSLPANRGSL